MLYIPIGAVLVGIVWREWFYVTAFCLVSMTHFLHDAASVPGIQWFWPLSCTAYGVERFRFVRVDDAERRRFYDQLRVSVTKRSILDEIRMRVGK